MKIVGSRTCFVQRAILVFRSHEITTQHRPKWDALFTFWIMS